MSKVVVFPLSVCCDDVCIIVAHMIGKSEFISFGISHPSRTSPQWEASAIIDPAILILLYFVFKNKIVINIFHFKTGTMSLAYCRANLFILSVYFLHEIPVVKS